MNDEEYKVELKEDDDPSKKYKFPWGIAIFIGVITLLMIAVIIVIINLK